MRLFHNPRCSKSRQALQLLHDAGVEPEVVEYLKTPPTAAGLDAICVALGREPHTILRFGEVEKEHYINVVNAPSPLAGGLPAGKRWVYPRDDEMGWGKPAPGATIIGRPEIASSVIGEDCISSNAQTLPSRPGVG